MQKKQRDRMFLADTYLQLILTTLGRPQVAIENLTGYITRYNVKQNQPL